MYAVCFGCSLLTNKYFPIFDIHLSSIFVGSFILFKFFLVYLSMSFYTHFFSLYICLLSSWVPLIWLSTYYILFLSLLNPIHVRNKLLSVLSSYYLLL